MSANINDLRSCTVQISPTRGVYGIQMMLSHRRALMQAFSHMHQAEQQENEANDHERDQRE